MTFKYGNQLQSRPDQPCPCPEKFAPRAFTAFRFVKSNPADGSDFLPPAIVIGGPRPKDKCGRIALSFFVSLETARQRYRELSEKMDVVSVFGTFIGKIDILATDGVSSLPGTSGHFDLHEFSDVVLYERMTDYWPAIVSPG